MASPNPEQVFSEAQQEWIRQLVEANRPPTSSTPATLEATSSSQDLPTSTTTAVTTSSAAGNLGKGIRSQYVLVVP